ncbi:MAG: SMC-Scp complex subunit ScpB [Clostridiales bacterium]|nr:SMC-Scp complex subunit ScpB [Clostridiales bacterium]
MEIREACRAIEAILFVSGDAVEIRDIAQALEITEMEALSAADALQKEYDGVPRGIRVSRYGEHLKLETRAEYAPYVERLLQPVQRQSLSQAAMETLAVIAYRQPVTRLDIEEVRGVKCDYSIQSLLNKGLVKNVGRRETLGRPYLYATTDFFLEHFGIADIRELPPLPEMDPPQEEEPLIP